LKGVGLELIREVTRAMYAKIMEENSLASGGKRLRRN
jgi:hypothetical protein